MTKGNSGNRFSTEVRVRAVRLVLENEADYKTRSECFRSISQKIGCLLGLDGLAGQPTMFLFSLGDNLGYLLSSSDALEVRADSAGTSIVGLKDRLGA